MWVFWVEANFLEAKSKLARQLGTWRAPTAKLARQVPSDHIIPEDLWARLAELATVELNPSMLEEVDLQAPGEGGGRY